jgi:hypothetical protein
MKKANIDLSDTKRKLLLDLRGRLYPLGFKMLSGESFTRAGDDGWVVSLSLESRMRAGLLICTPIVRATRSDISRIIEAGMVPYWQHPRRKRSASHAVFAKSLIAMAGIGATPEGMLDFRCADAVTIARAAKQIEAAVKSCLDEIKTLGATLGVLRLLRKERRNLPSRYIREIAAVLFAEERHRAMMNFIKGLEPEDTSPLDRSFCKYLTKLSRHGDE